MEIDLFDQLILYKDSLGDKLSLRDRYKKVSFLYKCMLFAWHDKVGSQ